VSLVVVVVGVLAENDDLDGVQGRVAGPRVDVGAGREDGGAALDLGLEEAFELQELGGDELVLEVDEPALVERVDLEGEQLLLLVGQGRDPGGLVELGGGRGILWGGRRLGRAEERGDAPRRVSRVCWV
jgi:hypothetical protein